MHLKKNKNKKTKKETANSASLSSFLSSTRGKYKPVHLGPPCLNFNHLSISNTKDLTIQFQSLGMQVQC